MSDREIRYEICNKIEQITGKNVSLIEWILHPFPYLFTFIEILSTLLIRIQHYICL